MRIHKPIDLNIKKEGKWLIIGDLPTLQVTLGTVAVQGNLHIYDVLKGNGKDFKGYKVPISRVRDQIKRMQERIRSIQNKIAVMEQIINVKR
jgi:hypothetical protein